MPALFAKALQIAAQIKDPVSVVAFALVIACIAFWIAFKKKEKKVLLTLGVILGIGIIFLGALPLLSRTYLSTHGVYEIRVMVLGLDGVPVNNSVVQCSPGGEQKSIDGGWECDVPPRNRPADGHFTAYATVKSAFLTGSGQLQLGDDYQPTLTIQLKQDSSAMVQGEVQDLGHHALAGARVAIVGREAESVATQQDGGFALATHASTGQMIKLHVEADGYQVYEGLQQAGDTSITIQLSR